MSVAIAYQIVEQHEPVQLAQSFRRTFGIGHEQVHRLWNVSARQTLVFLVRTVSEGLADVFLVHAFNHAKPLCGSGFRGLAIETLDHEKGVRRA